MSRYGRIAMVVMASWGLLGLACGDEPQPRSADWLTATTRETHVQYFEISRDHHATAECNDCHGGFETFTQFSCSQCHPQATMDAFHQGADIGGYVYDFPTCKSCHPNGYR